MSSKWKAIKCFARSVTNVLSARGRALAQRATLTARAAARRSCNRHGLANAVEELVRGAPAVTPSAAWVGIHTRRHGQDVYVARTSEAIHALKTAMALQNIQRECAEGEDEAVRTDEEKTTYYWNAVLEDGESFEIIEVQLEPGEQRPEEKNSTRAAKQPSAPEIYKVLVCSTAHVTREEAEILDHHGYARGEVGWLVWVLKDQDFAVPEIEHPSPGLKGAIDFARNSGCQYLLFDRDAETLEGVPDYDWDLTWRRAQPQETPSAIQV